MIYFNKLIDISHQNFKVLRFLSTLNKHNFKGSTFNGARISIFFSHL